MMEKWESFQETLEDIRSMSKKEFLLTMAVCILGGIVLGMLISPRKAVAMGCYNGNTIGEENKKNDANEEDETLDWED